MWEKIKKDADAVVIFLFCMSLILPLLGCGILGVWQYYLYICQTYGV